MSVRLPRIPGFIVSNKMYVCLGCGTGEFDGSFEIYTSKT